MQIPENCWPIIDNVAGTLLLVGFIVGGWLTGLIFTMMLLTGGTRSVLNTGLSTRPFVASLLWFFFWPFLHLVTKFDLTKLRRNGHR